MTAVKIHIAHRWCASDFGQWIQQRFFKVVMIALNVRNENTKPLPEKEPRESTGLTKRNEL